MVVWGEFQKRPKLNKFTRGASIEGRRGSAADCYCVLCGLPQMGIVRCAQLLRSTGCLEHRSSTLQMLRCSTRVCSCSPTTWLARPPWQRLTVREVKNLRSSHGHGEVRIGRDDDEADQRVGHDLQSYLSGAVCPHRRLPQVFMACKILTTIITRSKNGYSSAR